MSIIKPARTATTAGAGIAVALLMSSVAFAACQDDLDRIAGEFPELKEASLTIGAGDEAQPASADSSAAEGEAATAEASEEAGQGGSNEEARVELASLADHPLVLKMADGSFVDLRTEEQKEAQAQADTQERKPAEEQAASQEQPGQTASPPQQQDEQASSDAEPAPQEDAAQSASAQPASQDQQASSDAAPAPQEDETQSASAEQPASGSDGQMTDEAPDAVVVTNPGPQESWFVGNADFEKIAGDYAAAVAFAEQGNEEACADLAEQVETEIAALVQASEESGAGEGETAAEATEAAARSGTGEEGGRQTEATGEGGTSGRLLMLPSRSQPADADSTDQEGQANPQ